MSGPSAEKDAPCQHARVVAVLVGGANGNEVMWLCANRDCKQEFAPVTHVTSPEVTQP